MPGELAEQKVLSRWRPNRDGRFSRVADRGPRIFCRLRAILPEKTLWTSGHLPGGNLTSQEFSRGAKGHPAGFYDPGIYTEDAEDSDSDGNVEEQGARGGASPRLTRQRAREIQNTTLESSNLLSLRQRAKEILEATSGHPSLLEKSKENPEKSQEVPGTSKQADSNQADSAAVQMPLRALPIPPLQPDGPPRMVYTHQPFYTADLVNWSNQMPSLRDDPDKCHRQVSAIFSTHKPTWPDVHVLLNALFNEAEKADILAKAGEAIELPNYQTGRPQGLEPLTAQCLRTEPTWDYNTTNGIWYLNLFKRAILDGIKAAGQRTVNWTKVQSVLQGANEHPSDYYTRLVSAIKTWGGIDPENPQHEVIVKGFFKDQACPDIRKALNLQIGYDGKSISEILSIAKSVYNSRDERKKRDPKPETEQILALNDLLLCSTSEEACKMDTKHLLAELARKGHKVSPKKLQYCQQEVKYLGHILGIGTRSLATDRIEAVTKIPLPKTKRQLRGFLGMAGFCRAWIAGYSEITKPLSAMTRQDHPDTLVWEEEAYKSFERLKQELRSAPALGLPDYRIPFNLFVHEQMGVASGVLTQPFRDQERPVAYYSLQLDTTAKGAVSCLRAIAAAAILLEKAQETVLGHEITIHVPHSVSTLLTLKGCHHFSNSRLNRYEAVLLTPSNVTIKRVNSLNPATLLPLPNDGTPHHDCATIVRQAEKPREDLDHLPLENPDIILYTDGSSKVIEGERKTGYAVVTDFEVIEANPINPQYSAQAAELIALIRACEISENKRVTIYTDSKYCFGLVHTTGQIWLQRGFLTAAGSKISHAALVERLLTAIHLPTAIAVVHCKAHTRGRDPISKGNRRADGAAQSAALRPPNSDSEFQAPQIPLNIDTTQIYKEAPEEEKTLWQSVGAVQHNDVWVLPDGRTVLPKAWVPKLVRVLHQQTHWGKGRLIEHVKRSWYAPGLAVAATTASKNCVTCNSYNPKRQPRTPPGARLWAFVPFESLQLDFIDLPQCQGFKHALIIVDKLSSWVEGFPCRKPTASVVARALLQDIIPRFGVPRRLDSDRGTHFTAQIVQLVAKALRIKWDLHTPYHPQSSGQVERMNQEIKTQLGKLCRLTGLKWVNALPLVLHNIRSAPTGPLKLSPYELLFGRPPPVYNTQFPLSELELGEAELTNYVIQLQTQLQRLHHYAAIEGQNLPIDVHAHSFHPDDWILVKVYQKEPLQPAWEGPYQVLLTSPTAVKVGEKNSWLHHTRCKSSPPPQETEESDGEDFTFSTPPAPPTSYIDDDDQQTAPDRGHIRAQQTGPADRGQGRAQQTGPADRGQDRAQQTGPADRGQGRAQQTGPADRGRGRAQQTGPDTATSNWTSEIIPDTNTIKLRFRRGDSHV
ncbi:protein NYNRIN-like [Podarcis muralis]